MENPNKTLELLSAIKQLISRNDAVLENQDELTRTLLAGMKERPIALIPDSEIQKIKDTECRLPNLDIYAESIAKKAIPAIAQEIQKEIKAKIQIVMLGLVTVSTVLLCILGIITINYYSSDAYWARRYTNAVKSECLSQNEQEVFWEMSDPETFLPKGYSSNRSKGREDIRHLERLISKRERQLRKQKVRNWWKERFR